LHADKEAHREADPSERRDAEGVHGARAFGERAEPNTSQDHRLAEDTDELA